MYVPDNEGDDGATRASLSITFANCVCAISRLRNLEIGTQFWVSENAQRNLEIWANS